MDRLTALRANLGRALFPESQAGAAGLSRGKAALLAGALLAGGVILQLARLGPAGSLDALWAEDGAIFLPGALTQSFGHAIGSEYSGYLVLVPRLIGEAASALPLRDAPAVFSILSAALVTLSGLIVWHTSAGHIASPYLRGALALATVLTPVGGQETIDAAAYVSWSMLVATFWLLLWRPRTVPGAVAGGVFILFTALSNPGVWFFAPLVLLRALAARDRRDWILLGAYFAAAAVQVFTIANSSYDAIEPLWTADIWTVLLQRVVDGTAFGLRLGGLAWAHLGWPFLIVLTILAVFGLALGFRYAGRSARCLTAVAVPTALVMFVASVYQRAVGSPMLWPAGGHNGAAGRYAIVPVMLLIGAAMALIDSWERRRAPAWRRPWPSLAAAALVLVSVAISFPAWNTDVRGTPTWSSSLDAAAASCASEHLADVAVPVSPPGFGVQLSCAAIPAADRR